MKTKRNLTEFNYTHDFIIKCNLNFISGKKGIILDTFRFCPIYRLKMCNFHFLMESQHFETLLNLSRKFLGYAKNLEIESDFVLQKCWHLILTWQIRLTFSSFQIGLRHIFSTLATNANLTTWVINICLGNLASTGKVSGACTVVQSAQLKLDTVKLFLIFISESQDFSILSNSFLGDYEPILHPFKLIFLRISCLILAHFNYILKLILPHF